MADAPKLIDGVDFYMEKGKMVLTRHFLIKRGHCCNSGCRHCPYKAKVAPAATINVVGIIEPVRSDHLSGDRSGETDD